MFVYIIGNVEQNIFKLGTAVSPSKQLSSLQKGNPYKLSIVCKICLQNKNSAVLIERMGLDELAQRGEASDWITNLPERLVAQFESGHYLRSLAVKANAEVVSRDGQAAPSGRANLQRLTPTAKRKGLTFEDVLNRVEQAYTQGESIDEVIKF